MNVELHQLYHSMSFEDALPKDLVIYLLSAVAGSLGGEHTLLKGQELIATTGKALQKAAKVLQAMIESGALDEMSKSLVVSALLGKAGSESDSNSAQTPGTGFEDWFDEDFDFLFKFSRRIVEQEEGKDKSDSNMGADGV